MKKGNFVKVNKDIGVIVALEKEESVPEDHIGIWFGELTELNIPVYKTVPREKSNPA